MKAVVEVDRKEAKGDLRPGTAGGYPGGRGGRARMGRGIKRKAGGEPDGVALKSNPVDERARRSPGGRPCFPAVAGSFDATGLRQVSAPAIRAERLAAASQEANVRVQKDDRLLASAGPS